MRPIVLLLLTIKSGAQHGGGRVYLEIVNASCLMMLLGQHRDGTGVWEVSSGLEGIGEGLIGEEVLFHNFAD